MFIRAYPLYWILVEMVLLRKLKLMKTKGIKLLSQNLIFQSLYFCDLKFLKFEFVAKTQFLSSSYMPEVLLCNTIISGYGNIQFPRPVKRGEPDIFDCSINSSAPSFLFLFKRGIKTTITWWENKTITIIKINFTLKEGFFSKK